MPIWQLQSAPIRARAEDLIATIVALEEDISRACVDSKKTGITFTFEAVANGKVIVHCWAETPTKLANGQ